MQIRPWILAARPKTLPAAVAPVLLAGALAYHDGVINLPPLLLALLFAILIQIATNYANDYFDYIKGADTEDRQGPARAVASGMVSAAQMKAGTAICFALAFAEGLLLLPYGGWPLVAVGALSVLMGLAYTGGPFPMAYNGTADFFVMVFFGIVAVTVTYYVQTGTVTAGSFIASLAPGALATNILVVNNYRDAITDKAADKRTLIVRFGRKFGSMEYLLMLAIASAVPIAMYARSDSESTRGTLVLLPLLSLPPGIALWNKMLKSTTRKDYDKALAGTAIYLIVFILLLSLGLVLTKGA